MNEFMVRRLILKDWYFQRSSIAGYLGVGAVALLLISVGGEGAFYAGTVLILTVLITLGIHLAMTTVVAERAEQTLPFVMSLPISPRDYTAAKMLANVLIFLIPWLALVVGTMAVIGRRTAIADGLIPFAAIILTEIFAAYIVVLAVAMVSESQPWTVAAIVTTNLFFQGFLYYVSHIPQIAREMKGDHARWSSPVLILLAAEVAVIVALVVTTFVLQNRKKDFL